MLNNRMEAQKLNFEKPLLSARHFTSGASQENGSKWKIEDSVRSVRRAPKYKSELKSGPVSNPGTVPFGWEQIPGRPKDDEASLSSHEAESYQVPKLPPGRTLIVVRQDFDKFSANSVVHKDQIGSVSHDSSNIQSLDEKAKQSGSFRDVKEEVENSNSANEDEDFVDALETLSRAESSLINCSLSGLQDAGMKGCRISPIDSQTRDFMMGRFLPAAKAMASEAPQHTPRKQPVVRQQVKPLSKKVNEDKCPQLRYGPDFALEHLQSNGNEDEDEESDGDYDKGEIFQRKLCGLLPGLGFRNSLCLLNPLPGMSMRSRTPTPLRKSQAGTSSWSWSQTDRKISTVGLHTSKHQANRKDLENNAIPIDHISLDKVGFPSFRELMAEENQSRKKNIGSPVAVKTLYVDTEDEVRSLHVRSCSSDSNGHIDFEVRKHEILDEERDQIQMLDSSLNEAVNLMGEGVKSEIKFRIHDFHIVSSTGEANQKTGIGMQAPSAPQQDIFKGSKMLPKGPRKSESKLNSELLAPPPLPKSPSDSWLGRTLTSKSTSVHSYRGSWITPKDQASNTKSSDPKWETLVRMTKMQDKNLGFSEDLLTPIPEA